MDTPSPSAKTDADRVSAARFAEVVAEFSRFLNKVSALPALKEAGLGMSEWAALSMLAKEKASNKQLARDLGLTKQRVNQITDGLKASGLIEMNRSADDARASDISLAEAGRARLAEVNGKLEEALGSTLTGKERTLESVAKHLRGISKGIAEPKVERTAEPKVKAPKTKAAKTPSPKAPSPKAKTPKVKPPKVPKTPA